MSQILAINRVRDLGSRPHTPTQFFWEYPRGHLSRGIDRRVVAFVLSKLLKGTSGYYKVVLSRSLQL